MTQKIKIIKIVNIINIIKIIKIINRNKTIMMNEMMIKDIKIKAMKMNISNDQNYQDDQTV